MGGKNLLNVSTWPRLQKRALWNKWENADLLLVSKKGEKLVIYQEINLKRSVILIYTQKMTNYEDSGKKKKKIHKSRKTIAYLGIHWTRNAINLYEENIETVPKNAKEGLKNKERHAIFLSRTQHHKIWILPKFVYMLKAIPILCP